MSVHPRAVSEARRRRAHEAACRVRLVGSVASLVGVGLYNSFFKRMRLRKLFFWTAIGAACGI